MSELDQLLRDVLGGSGGASEPVVLGLFARMLPLVIHRPTPQGQIPQRDPLLELRGR